MEIVYTKHLVSASSTVDETRYMPTYRKLTLKRILLVPNETTAADGSNYLTLTVTNGSTTLATRTTESAALTAGTVEALTLVATVDLDFSDLGAIKIVKTHTGSGAVCDVEFAFEFDARRDA